MIKKCNTTDPSEISAFILSIKINRVYLEYKCHYSLLIVFYSSMDVSNILSYF